MWGSIYIKPTGITWWGDGVCDNNFVPLYLVQSLPNG